MIEKLEKLKNKIKSKIFFDYRIGNLTWFKTGGKAKAFIIVDNQKELQILINILGDYKYLIIGSGSNILFRDKGFNGIIMKLGKGFNDIKIFEDEIKVGASILDVNLSRFAKKNLINNFEFLSGIPGTIGGAVKMNAGCFGNETKNILKRIEIINTAGNIKEINTKKLNLQYRSSDLKDSDIVTNATFEITYGSKDEINKKIEKIKFQREKKQPLKEKTSGSTFKNPPNNYAAKLIESSGCKGLVVGDAQVSLKHANFLINMGKATSTDIEELGKIIKEKVFQKFNIILDWEIKIIGD